MSSKIPFVPRPSDILVFSNEEIERKFNRSWNRFKRENADFFKGRSQMSRISNKLIRVAMRSGFYNAMMLMRRMVETGKIRGIRK